MIGAGLVLFEFIPVLKPHRAKLALYMPIVALLAIGLDAAIGLRESALNQLGRDATFTGRTQVWEFLLNEHTDPIFGTGYYSLWSTPSFRHRMPYWMSNSAHNGYLEAYIEGGYIEIFFLALMIVSIWSKINRKLHSNEEGAEGAVVALAFFMIALVDNFSESYFARLSLVWFAFILFGIDRVPRMRSRKETARSPKAATLVTAKEPAFAG